MSLLTNFQNELFFNVENEANGKTRMSSIENILNFCSGRDDPSFGCSEHSKWNCVHIFVLCVYRAARNRIIQMSFMQRHLSFIDKLKFQLDDCVHSFRKYFESRQKWKKKTIIICLIAIGSLILA